MEIWKDIPGYEGKYQCSNIGRIKSLSRLRECDGFMVCGKTFNYNKNHSGYYQVILRKDNNRKMFRIHRLVAITFLPNPYNKKQVNHKNGIKTDNRVENLEWATPSENQKHSFLIGLQTNRGTNHSQAKLSESDVIAIRNEYSYRVNSACKVGKKYGISRAHVYDIVNRKTWSHL